jgi:hypothetical protein
MIDYNNAHRLPSSLQRAIYHIVMSDFHPQTLMNRVFFVDDSSSLLEPDTMNAFFEWSTTISRARRMAEHQGSSFLGVGSDEQGQQEPIPNVLRKLMVCTSSWLNEYCILPLYRLNERLAMAALSFSSIAPAVSDGESSASAAPNARDHSAFLFLSDNQQEQQCAAVCCGGRDCIAGGNTPIRGPRYRCNVCPNFDLCEICYNDLAGHDQTHAFEMIASGPGVRPHLLQARVQAVTECCSSTLCNNDRQEDIPVAFAVPILLPPPVILEEKEGDGAEAGSEPLKNIKKHKRRRLS